jgi:hypothetical protein
VGDEHRPRFAMAVGAMRSLRLTDPGDQLVGDLVFTAGVLEATSLRHSDAATQRRAVLRSTAASRPIERKLFPRSHTRSILGSHATEDPGLPSPPSQFTDRSGSDPGWSCDERGGGPMLLAKLSSGWSHVICERHGVLHRMPRIAFR